jgi:hypothetical protein
MARDIRSIVHNTFTRLGVPNHVGPYASPVWSIIFTEAFGRAPTDSDEALWRELLDRDKGAGLAYANEFCSHIRVS